MQPIYLNTYKIYILNAKVMKKNESAKKKEIILPYHSL